MQTDRTTAQEQGDDGGAGGSRARVSADEGPVMGGRVFSSFFSSFYFFVVSGNQTNRPELIIALLS